MKRFYFFIALALAFALPLQAFTLSGEEGRVKVEGGAATIGVTPYGISISSPLFSWGGGDVGVVRSLGDISGGPVFTFEPGSIGMNDSLRAGALKIGETVLFFIDGERNGTGLVHQSPSFPFFIIWGQGIGEREIMEEKALSKKDGTLWLGGNVYSGALSLSIALSGTESLSFSSWGMARLETENLIVSCSMGAVESFGGATGEWRERWSASYKRENWSVEADVKLGEESIFTASTRRFEGKYSSSLRIRGITLKSESRRSMKDGRDRQSVRMELCGSFWTVGIIDGRPYGTLKWKDASFSLSSVSGEGSVSLSGGEGNVTWKLVLKNGREPALSFAITAFPL